MGTLTTGNGSGRYLLAGPGWDGQKPAGITNVIRSETDFIFNATRTQFFGPDDLKAVKAIQAQYTLQPLSTFLGKSGTLSTIKLFMMPRFDCAAYAMTVQY